MNVPGTTSFSASPSTQLLLQSYGVSVRHDRALRSVLQQNGHTQAS